MTDFRSNLIIELNKQAAANTVKGINTIADAIKKMGETSPIASPEKIAALKLIEANLKQQAMLQEDADKAEIAAQKHIADAARLAAKEKEATLKQQVMLQEELIRLAAIEVDEAIKGAQAEARRADQEKKRLEALRNPRQPVFLQFALFPAASLAQRAGAKGIADALFTASDVAGILDNASIVGTSVRTLAERLKSGTGPISQIANAAGALAAPLGVTAASFVSLIAVAAPLVVVGVALFKVIGDLNAQFEEATKKAQAFLDAQVKVSEQVATGATTDELRAGIDTETARRDANQALINIYQPLIDERNEQLAKIANGDMSSETIGAGFDLNQRVSELTGGEIGSIDLLAAELDRLKLSVSGSSTQINALQTAIDTQATAENDAKAEAIRIGEAALEFSRREAEQRQQYAQLLRSGSIQDVETLIQQEQDRLSLNQQLIPSLESLAATDEAYQEQLNDARLTVIDATGNLAELDKVLAGVIQRTALAKLLLDTFNAATESAADAIKLASDQIDAYKKALDQLADKQNDLIRRFNEANTSADNQYYFDRDKLARDFEADQIDAEIEEQKRAAKLAQDHNDDLEKIEQDHNRRVAKIERDFNRSAATAIAERDALAYTQAQQRRDDALTDEQERYEDAKAERDKDYKRQLEDLKANLQDQQDKRRRDYEQRLDELRRAYEFERGERQRKYAADIAQLQAEFAAETVARNAHFAESMAALTNHLMQRYALETQYYEASMAAIQRILGGGTTTTSSSTSGSSGVGAGSGTTGYTSTAFAGGGDTPAYRDFLVGEDGPEVLRLPVRGHVYTSQQYGAQSGGGVNYSPQISGAGLSARRVRQIADRQLADTLRDVGWPD